MDKSLETQKTGWDAGTHWGAYSHIERIITYTHQYAREGYDNVFYGLYGKVRPVRPCVPRYYFLRLLLRADGATITLPPAPGLPKPPAAPTPTQETGAPYRPAPSPNSTPLTYAPRPARRTDAASGRGRRGGGGKWRGSWVNDPRIRAMFRVACSAPIVEPDAITTGKASAP